MALHFSVSALPTPNPNPNPQPTPAPAPMPEPLLSNNIGGALPSSTKTNTNSHKTGGDNGLTSDVKGAPGAFWQATERIGKVFKTGAGLTGHGISDATKTLGHRIGF